MGRGSLRVEDPHDWVDDSLVAGVVFPLIQVSSWGQLILLWRESRSTSILAEYIVSDSKKSGVEEELVVSDSAWQILLFENLIVVDAEAGVRSNVLVES